ncbi:protein kinase STUNTED-like isoform X2 [Musa acuminata AAA Group]|uniref:protein kinase STUNTED-like isoform X2 n=1 Tax=Musa acuminata AAA Group TaxID=214697 RepID=UPI0031DD08E7
MAVLEGEKQGESRCIMVGLQMNAKGKELLDWAIHKVAEQGDRVMAVHVCRDSDLKKTTTLSLASTLDDHLASYQGICSLKQVVLVGRIARGSSIRRALVKEAKQCAAIKVVVGMKKKSSFFRSAPLAKYCAKNLPPTTALIAVRKGNVVFERGAAKPSPESQRRQSLRNLLYPSEALAIRKHEEKTVVEASRSSDSNHVKGEKVEAVLSSVTVLMRQLPEPVFGCPLLKKKAALRSIEVKRANRAWRLSLVRRVMNLPARTLSSAQPLLLLIEELNTVLSGSNSSCRWFQYEELQNSTNRFSSENLIGNGGCSRVYRGRLGNGQQVAIKLSKLSAEASKDFLSEVDIITKLRHLRVVPLLGICVGEHALISVYRYFPNGSLEQNLHGDKVKHLLPWDRRFRVATEIAEALSYLHHGCRRPVIHRDVKSSNILLNDEFEPQLSDFGLAMWAPTTATNLTQSDVVGTFGYLAPEYLMYGKVSNKNDVYAFGVVLLELLTGRKPIDDGNPKGEESLVMWATRILERGELIDLLDPNLGTNHDKGEVSRMILAASLCITRVPRIRPQIDKICSLLKGEEDMETWISSQADGMSEVVDCPDDEAYPTPSLALLDVDDDASVASVEQSHCGSWEAYLRSRWSRSSSFN